MKRIIFYQIPSFFRSSAFRSKGKSMDKRAQKETFSTSNPRNMEVQNLTKSRFSMITETKVDPRHGYSSPSKHEMQALTTTQHFVQNFEDSPRPQ